jgi:hypothetical protein
MLSAKMDAAISGRITQSQKYDDSHFVVGVLDCRHSRKSVVHGFRNVLYNPCMNHFRAEWNALLGAQIQVTTWALIGTVIPGNKSSFPGWRCGICCWNEDCKG